MKLLSLFLLVAASLCCKAQPGDSLQKIGHADREYIFSLLPEYKQIETELKTFQGQLEKQLKIKDEELTAKYAVYQALPKNTPDAIRHDKESELAYLQENLQKFQHDAEASMQKKQADLLKPVLEKIANAIAAVAEENGYAYIINPQMPGSGDILLFAGKKNDISNLVLEKLGVQVSGQPNHADGR